MSKVLMMTFLAALTCTTVACAIGPEHASIAPPVLADVAPFPAAKAGQARHVIWLPKKAEEALLKVELVPGQVLQTDCNTHGLIATLTAQDLAGFGYTYYELSNVKGPIATLMACPEGTEKQAFVAAQSDNYMLGYNSKLPIVVYTPENLEVRYRIWSGDKDLHSATVD